MSDRPFQPESQESTGSDRLRYHLRKVQRHPAYLSAKRSLRTARELVPTFWRQATHAWRELPSAVIVGAQKAGTTQLYAYLVKHPRCFGGVNKEVRYFSTEPLRPVSWYHSQFPLSARVRRVGGQCIEASPAYLAMPAALRTMRGVLPEARVIAILRDPVARAFSGYQHNKTRHREARSFEEVVDEQIRDVRFPPELGATLGDAAPAMLDCVARGYYALQLEVLLSCYPREQVLVLDSAELFADTNATCQRVFEFLGLERYEVQPHKVFNRGYYRETIRPETAARLREHYRPYDELLAGLLGQRFSWMGPAVSAEQGRSVFHNAESGE